MPLHNEDPPGYNLPEFGSDCCIIDVSDNGILIGGNGLFLDISSWLTAELSGRVRELGREASEAEDWGIGGKTLPLEEEGGEGFLSIMSSHSSDFTGIKFANI